MLSKSLKTVGLYALLMLGNLCAFAEEATIERELDAYWSSVAGYLAAGDYDGLVSTYHPEAVLVGEMSGTSYPIAQALERWKPGILDTKAGKAMSLVEFRITRRFFSETTSHEQGIFHFRSGPTGADAKPEEFDEAKIHFEALLLKSDRWTMVMEYQKQLATEAEWNAAQLFSRRSP